MSSAVAARCGTLAAPTRGARDGARARKTRARAMKMKLMPLAPGDRATPRRARASSSSAGDAGSERATTSSSGRETRANGGLAAVTADVERRVNEALIGVAVTVIDNLYGGRSYARFHALETVARVPYFSFMSVLHLYETFGWWRKADYLKVHFAETMNEYHHLLIMESLGGAELWKDRFVAQHIAVAYYWICVAQYLVSPRWAYNLLETGGIARVRDVRRIFKRQRGGPEGDAAAARGGAVLHQG